MQVEVGLDLRPHLGWYGDGLLHVGLLGLGAGAHGKLSFDGVITREDVEAHFDVEGWEHLEAAEAAAAVEEAPAMTMFPIPDYGADLWSRPALTGDWGGLRTSLAENNGIQLDAKVHNYYQGVVSGGTAPYQVTWTFDGGDDGLDPAPTGGLTMAGVIPVA